jgi:hypothetical protein
LAGFLGQQMGSCFANGSIVGPLSVKPFDPYQDRVVLSDVLGGKDVDGRMDRRLCQIVIRRIRVKTELYP